jgi:ribonuclease P protein component
MAVSVPKRLFKKAVDRNLIKRRIREISSFRSIEDGMVQGMRKILHLLDEKL